MYFCRMNIVLLKRFFRESREGTRRNTILTRQVLKDETQCGSFTGGRACAS